jgi:hypothetical protein
MQKKLLVLFLITSFLNLHAQQGSIVSTQKISALEGNLTAQLDAGDYFGYSLANIGDVDKDGVTDVAVGSILFEDSSQGSYSSIGAVYILFLQSVGKVKAHQIIYENMGGLNAILHNTDRFGTAVEGIGDMNGDSIPDLAVGQVGLYGEGYVWILFLNTDGTVQSYQQIGYGNLGGFSGNINSKCFFGSSIANLGDINDDGVNDLAVGQPADDDGYTDAGAVWILKMNADGTVKANQKISALSGDFNGTLTNFSCWGLALEAAGDFNNDGITELLVGEPFSGLSSLSNGGELWLLSIDSSGIVTSESILYGYKHQSGSEINIGDFFGSAIAFLGDINKDGVNDIAVGSYASDEYYSSSGSVLILFLDSSNTVWGVQEISATKGNMSGLDGGDEFGYSLSSIGDLNGDDTPDMIAGAIGDDDGGSSVGAAYNCFLSDGMLTGIMDSDIDQNKILIYPNPSIGIFHIFNLNSQKVNLDIYSGTGKIIYSDTFFSNEAEINLSTQPYGIYFIKIKTEEGCFFKKAQVASH